MKEIHYFYTPIPEITQELSEEDVAHAIRVLRMTEGDEIMLMNGKGTFYRAVITLASKKRCLFNILEAIPQKPLWNGRIHLAMAPTKNIDRIEWMVEKATEIGFDELTFLCCKNSERKIVKTERIEKIVVSAMKQSRKPFKPLVNPIINFEHFLNSDFPCNKYICHCHDMNPDKNIMNKPLLKDVLKANDNSLVLIGPEGDFSREEVEMAEKAGFLSVSLGESRLRTETAALVAVHLMNIFC